MYASLLKLTVFAVLVAHVAAIAAPTAEWTIAAEAKTASDPAASNAFVFTFNGVHRPALEATVGQTYTYKLAATASTHVFAISNDWTTNTAIAGTTATPGGAAGTWTPTVAGTYGYICTVTGHVQMGNTITVTAAAASTSSGGAAPATPAAGSICDYYTEKLGMGMRTDAAAEQKLVRAVVERAVLGYSAPAGGVAVTGVAKLAKTMDYFNGNIKYSGAATPDYVSNAAQREALVVKLIAFFGKALGCTATGYPVYSTTFPNTQGGTTQYAIHRNMNITQSVFAAFNNEVANSALSYGVSQAEVTAVGGILNSFGRNVVSGTPAGTAICWRADGADACTCAPSQTGADCGTTKPLDSAASSASTSFIVLALAALMALLAVRA